MGRAGKSQEVIDQRRHLRGRFADLLDMLTILFSQQRACVVRDQLREAQNPRQRIAQIVGHRIRERLKFLVGRLQKLGPPLQVLVETLDHLFAPDAYRDLFA